MISYAVLYFQISKEYNLWLLFMTYTQTAYTWKLNGTIQKEVFISYLITSYASIFQMIHKIIWVLLLSQNILNLKIHV